MQFHLDLAKATQNIIVPLLIQAINGLLPRIKPVVYAKVDDSKAVALIWYKKILDAVVNQDQETAFQEMIEHLRIVEVNARTVLETIENTNSEIQKISINNE